MRPITIACFFLVFVAGAVGSSDTALAINFSGFLQNSSNAPVSGITVFQAENVAIHSNPSASDGSFTLTGLPSGTDFSLKFVDTNSSPSYAIGYSRNYNRTTGASGSTFTIFTPTEITAWYQNTSPLVVQNSNGGTIRGRVADADTDLNIGGAKVTYTSSLGKTYPLYYYNGTASTYVAGQATFANGHYLIFNVADGDAVNITVSKTGWVFNPITFDTHSGILNVSGGKILGSTPKLYLPLILSTSNSVVGTWDFVNCTGSCSGVPNQIVFNADGTGQGIGTNSDANQTFSWTQQGNQGTVKVADGTSVTFSLSGSNLTITNSSKQFSVIFTRG
jgi:hypothetical protein